MPAQQDFSNHRKLYPLHHFVLLPLGAALVAVCANRAIRQSEDRFLWLVLTAFAVMMLLLSLMMRQHYALGNQNRIVRLEMRLRYFQLTGRRFEPLEGQLSFGQIAALRFASDAELPALTQRALDEKLAPDAIKKSIAQWQADDMRV